MAFTNETVTSIADFIDKLDTWMSSNGWTSEHKDTTTTASTGGEWAMRRTAGATNVRFSASWDSANSGINLALYQYSDQNYVVGDRPWGQDHDSGNGFAGTTPDGSIDNERHVVLSSAPLQYWAFEGDDYTHVVVEYTLGRYAHFGWGMLDKLGGDWTGGEYCYGQRNNLTSFVSGSSVWDGMSFLLDGQTNDTPDAGGEVSGMEQFCATVHAESMPGMTANQMWCIVAGGKQASAQTAFGTDRQSNDGASSDEDRELMTWGLRSGPFASQYYRFDGLDVSGHVAMWPVCLTYVDGNDIHGAPLAQMKDTAGINIRNYSGGDTILIGGDTWVVFPANRKWPGSGSGSSGYLGVAYKQVS